MENNDAAMLTFLTLATVSQARGQLGPCDKFLVLAAAAASRGGRREVSAHCRAVVLMHNPAHLLKHFATFEESLADADFQLFYKRLIRFCSQEKAEHLVWQLQDAADLPRPPADLPAEKAAMWMLENWADHSDSNS